MPSKSFESLASVNFDLTKSFSLCSYSLSKAKELLTVPLPAGGRGGGGGGQCVCVCVCVEKSKESPHTHNKSSVHKSARYTHVQLGLRGEDWLITRDKKRGKEKAFGMLLVIIIIAVFTSYKVND